MFLTEKNSPVWKIRTLHRPKENLLIPVKEGGTQTCTNIYFLFHCWINTAPICVPTWMFSLKMLMFSWDKTQE